jgi:hypothetical protein
LFSTTKTTGNLWMPAKLSASKKSPWLLDPSPVYVMVTWPVLRSFAASAIPVACRTCVVTGELTERIWRSATP